MLSLSFCRSEEQFAEKTSKPLKENLCFQKNANSKKGQFRDFCGDCVLSDVIVKTLPKNKVRKENRFQPLRSSVLTLTKYPSDILEILPFPNQHICLESQKIDKLSQKSQVSTSSRFIVRTREMKEFFKLTDDVVIQGFLKSDRCKRIADKYLLAMVFAYFKRADLSIQEYTRTNFFIGLYLANEVEEDEEEIKYEIFPWVLGEKWKNKYPGFLKLRDNLLRRIDYKAIISRRCCDEIMAIDPDNILWKRDRPAHHGGALRSYMKSPGDDSFPRGPHASPRYCPECDVPDSQYDSASPASTSWFISSQDSSPEDMKGSEHENENNDIWPSIEE